MNVSFETLINTYIETNIGIADHFLSNTLANNLRANLLDLHKRNCLVAAGIGNDTIVNHNKQTRSDSIYWLDRKHNDPYENEFFDLIDAFVLYLNETCYTGITGYEFHYTLYEKGSFYKKHLDQFQNNESRLFSIISYLNEDWQEKDGGHLLIHQVESQQKIAPINGNTVFFKSNQLVHEVLETNRARLSITGWLKK